jgi:hypothetical protein
VSKSPPPAEGDETGGGGPRAELQVVAAEERWTWRYVEPDTGVELDSNETFASREAAVDWARRAYPDVPFAEDEGSEPETESA